MKGQAARRFGTLAVLLALAACRGREEPPPADELFDNTAARIEAKAREIEAEAARGVASEEERLAKEAAPPPGAE